MSSGKYFMHIQDVTYLWIKGSSVIQTLSAAHIKGKMSNLPINTFININLQPGEQAAGYVELTGHSEPAGHISPVPR
jgi:ABC-type phosphate transport system substrate-binding protein